MSLSQQISSSVALRHRALITLTGARDDCHQAAAQLLKGAQLSEGSALIERGAWRGLESALQEALRDATWALEPLSWSSSRALLGRSVDLLVVDLFDGLNPDALGATLGTVRGGGLIILMTPPEPPRQGSLLKQLLVWPHRVEGLSTRCWDRWWSLLEGLEAQQRLSAAQVIQEGQVMSPPFMGPSLREPLNEWSRAPRGEGAHHINPLDPSQALDLTRSLCRTEGQRALIEQVLRSQARQGFTAVSITAHRGRGKSYALGLSAATLLLQGEGEVCLTAPRLEALEAVFEAAERALSLAGSSPKLQGDLLQSQSGVIRYVSPAALWAREQPFRCLFIDEAASLPVPLLIRLLEGRPKLIFSTTTHGYEGSGRGFSLRFRPILQRRLKKLYEHSLSEPIRWGEGDPIEAWSFSSLLLDASVSLSRGARSPEACQYTLWDRAQLVEDEGQLRAIFGLLVSAHYRTQPSDVWRLLDAPNLSVHTLSDEQGVAAVALISEEGGLPSEMAAAIYEGRDRPRGQMFAANFCVHLNCEEAAALKMARVVRVAARPQDQSRGLGAELLRRVERWAEGRGVELFGSSFGVSARLLSFWLKQGFKPLRVSVRQSDMSGARSALVCKGLTARAQGLLTELEGELVRDFEAQLRGPLKQLELEAAVMVILASPPLSDPRGALSQRDWRALSACAFAGRAYELSERGAHALALCALSVAPLGGGLDEQAKALGLATWAWRVYLLKALQGHRWLEITRAEQLDGPAVAMKAVSQAQRALLWRYAPEWLIQEARRFPRFSPPS